MDLIVSAATFVPETLRSVRCFRVDMNFASSIGLSFRVSLLWEMSRVVRVLSWEFSEKFSGKSTFPPNAKRKGEVLDMSSLLSLEMSRNAPSSLLPSVANEL